MTDHDDRYDAYLSEFGARLTAAGQARDAPATGSARRFTGGVAATLRRPLVAGALACVAAVAAGFGVVGLPGGGSLDAVARASAALAPDGQIVHVRLTSTFVPTEPDSTGPGPQTIEYWTAPDPARWRMAWTMGGVACVRVDPENGEVIERYAESGRAESAYADGATYDYLAEPDTLRIVTGYSADGGPSRVPSLIGVDPELDIRPLLERGELHDTGELVVGGRRVRRLQGEADMGPGDRDTIRRVTYDVDADSFEPVGGRVELTFTDGPGGRRMQTRTDFRVDLYERLPDDAAHAHLLKPQTTPQTKVTTETLEELRQRMERELREGSGPPATPYTR